MTPDDQVHKHLQDRAVSIEIWREAMEHLRHLNTAFWRDFVLFFCSNLFLLLGLAVTVQLSQPNLFVIIILAIFGLVLSLLGRMLLKRHRTYYLQMLAKKSLIEEDLGFYRTEFAAAKMDLAFPWRLSPEAIAEIKHDFEGWSRKSIRGKGTMARMQFLILDLFLGLYAFVLLLGAATFVPHA